MSAAAIGATMDSTFPVEVKESAAAASARTSTTEKATPLERSSFEVFESIENTLITVQQLMESSGDMPVMLNRADLDEQQLVMVRKELGWHVYQNAEGQTFFSKEKITGLDDPDAFYAVGGDEVGSGAKSLKDLKAKFDAEKASISPEDLNWARSFVQKARNAAVGTYNALEKAGAAIEKIGTATYKGEEREGLRAWVLNIANVEKAIINMSYINMVSIFRDAESRILAMEQYGEYKGNNLFSKILRSDTFKWGKITVFLSPETKPIIVEVNGVKFATNELDLEEDNPAAYLVRQLVSRNSGLACDMPTINYIKNHIGKPLGRLTPSLIVDYVQQNKDNPDFIALTKKWDMAVSYEKKTLADRLNTVVDILRNPVALSNIALSGARTAFSLVMWTSGVARFVPGLDRLSSSGLQATVRLLNTIAYPLQRFTDGMLRKGKNFGEVLVSTSLAFIPALLIFSGAQIGRVEAEKAGLIWKGTDIKSRMMNCMSRSIRRCTTASGIRLAATTLMGSVGRYWANATADVREKHKRSIIVINFIEAVSEIMSALYIPLELEATLHGDFNIFERKEGIEDYRMAGRYGMSLAEYERNKHYLEELERTTPGTPPIEHPVSLASATTEPIVPGTTAHVMAPGGGTCFLAGTKVTLGDNTLKSIEKVQIGDEVLGYDHINNKLVSQSVTNVFQHEVKEYLKLKFKSQISNSKEAQSSKEATEIISNIQYLVSKQIKKSKNQKIENISHPTSHISDLQISLKVTGEHRVYVGSKHSKADTEGFVAVSQLELGDVVYKNENGALEELEVVSIKKVEAEISVYNITTEITHTYFANGISVHNDKAMSMSRPIGEVEMGVGTRFGETHRAYTPEQVVQEKDISLARPIMIDDEYFIEDRKESDKIVETLISRREVPLRRDGTTPITVSEDGPVAIKFTDDWKVRDVTTTGTSEIKRALAPIEIYQGVKGAEVLEQLQAEGTYTEYYESSPDVSTTVGAGVLQNFAGDNYAKMVFALKPAATTAEKDTIEFIGVRVVKTDGTHEFIPIVNNPNIIVDYADDGRIENIAMTGTSGYDGALWWNSSIPDSKHGLPTTTALYQFESIAAAGSASTPTPVVTPATPAVVTTVGDFIVSTDTAGAYTIATTSGTLVDPATTHVVLDLTNQVIGVSQTSSGTTTVTKVDGTEATKITPVDGSAPFFEIDSTIYTSDSSGNVTKAGTGLVLQDTDGNLNIATSDGITFYNKDGASVIIDSERFSTTTGTTNTYFIDNNSLDVYELDTFNTATKMSDRLLIYDTSTNLIGIQKFDGSVLDLQGDAKTIKNIIATDTQQYLTIQEGDTFSVYNLASDGTTTLNSTGTVLTSTDRNIIYAVAPEGLAGNLYGYDGASYGNNVLAVSANGQYYFLSQNDLLIINPDSTVTTGVEGAKIIRDTNDNPILFSIDDTSGFYDKNGTQISDVATIKHGSDTYYVYGDTAYKEDDAGIATPDPIVPIISTTDNALIGLAFPTSGAIPDIAFSDTFLQNTNNSAVSLNIDSKNITLVTTGGSLAGKKFFLIDNNVYMINSSGDLEHVIGKIDTDLGVFTPGTIGEEPPKVFSLTDGSELTSYTITGDSTTGYTIVLPEEMATPIPQVATVVPPTSTPVTATPVDGAKRVPQIVSFDYEKIDQEGYVGTGGAGFYIENEGGTFIVKGADKETILDNNTISYALLDDGRVLFAYKWNSSANSEYYYYLGTINNTPGSPGTLEKIEAEELANSLNIATILPFDIQNVNPSGYSYPENSSYRFTITQTGNKPVVLNAKGEPFQSDLVNFVILSNEKVIFAYSTAGQYKYYEGENSTGVLQEIRIEDLQRYGITFNTEQKTFNISEFKSNAVEILPTPMPTDTATVVPATVTPTLEAPTITPFPTDEPTVTIPPPTVAPTAAVQAVEINDIANITDDLLTSTTPVTYTTNTTTSSVYVVNNTQTGMVGIFDNEKKLFIPFVQDFDTSTLTPESPITNDMLDTTNMSVFVAGQTFDGVIKVSYWSDAKIDYIVADDTNPFVITTNDNQELTATYVDFINYNDTVAIDDIKAVQGGSFNQITVHGTSYSDINVISFNSNREIDRIEQIDNASTPWEATVNDKGYLNAGIIWFGSDGSISELRLAKTATSGWEEEIKGTKYSDIADIYFVPKDDYLFISKIEKRDGSSSTWIVTANGVICSNATGFSISTNDERNIYEIAGDPFDVEAYGQTYNNANYIYFNQDGTPDTIQTADTNNGWAVSMEGVTFYNVNSIYFSASKPSEVYFLRINEKYQSEVSFPGITDSSSIYGVIFDSQKGNFLLSSLENDENGKEISLADLVNANPAATQTPAPSSTPLPTEAPTDIPIATLTPELTVEPTVIPTDLPALTATPLPATPIPASSSYVLNAQGLPIINDLSANLNTSFQTEGLDSVNYSLPEGSFVTGKGGLHQLDAYPIEYQSASGTVIGIFDHEKGLFVPFEPGYALGTDPITADSLDTANMVYVTRGLTVNGVSKIQFDSEGSNIEVLATQDDSNLEIIAKDGIKFSSQSFDISQGLQIQAPDELYSVAIGDNNYGAVFQIKFHGDGSILGITSADGTSWNDIVIGDNIYNDVKYIVFTENQNISEIVKAGESTSEWNVSYGGVTGNARTIRFVDDTQEISLIIGDPLTGNVGGISFENFNSVNFKNGQVEALYFTNVSPGVFSNEVIVPGISNPNSVASIEFDYDKNEAKVVYYEGLIKKDLTISFANLGIQVTDGATPEPTLMPTLTPTPVGAVSFPVGTVTYTVVPEGDKFNVTDGTGGTALNTYVVADSSNNVIGIIPQNIHGTYDPIKLIRSDGTTQDVAVINSGKTHYYVIEGKLYTDDTDTYEIIPSTDNTIGVLQSGTNIVGLDLGKDTETGAIGVIWNADFIEPFRQNPGVAHINLDGTDATLVSTNKDENNPLFVVQGQRVYYLSDITKFTPVPGAIVDTSINVFSPNPENGRIFSLVDGKEIVTGSWGIAGDKIVEKVQINDMDLVDEQGYEGVGVVFKIAYDETTQTYEMQNGAGNRFIGIVAVASQVENGDMLFYFNGNICHGVKVEGEGKGTIEILSDEKLRQNYNFEFDRSKNIFVPIELDATATATQTALLTQTSTPEPSATFTPTPVPPTLTSTPTFIPTSSPTATPAPLDINIPALDDTEITVTAGSYTINDISTYGVFDEKHNLFIPFKETYSGQPITNENVTSFLDTENMVITVTSANESLTFEHINNVEFYNDSQNGIQRITLAKGTDMLIPVVDQDLPLHAATISFSPEGKMNRITLEPTTITLWGEEYDEVVEVRFERTQIDNNFSNTVTGFTFATPQHNIVNEVYNKNFSFNNVQSIDFFPDTGNISLLLSADNTSGTHFDLPLYPGTTGIEFTNFGTLRAVYGGNYEIEVYGTTYSGINRILFNEDIEGSINTISSTDGFNVSLSDGTTNATFQVVSVTFENEVPKDIYFYKGVTVVVNGKEEKVFYLTYSNGNIVANETTVPFSKFVTENPAFSALTATSTATYTATAVPPTATETLTQTPTPTLTEAPTDTSVPPTATYTPSETPTSTDTATFTASPVPPTDIPTLTATPLPSATSTLEGTATQTVTSTPVPVATITVGGEGTGWFIHENDLQRNVEITQPLDLVPAWELEGETYYAKADEISSLTEISLYTSNGSDLISKSGIGLIGKTGSQNYIYAVIDNQLYVAGRDGKLVPSVAPEYIVDLDGNLTPVSEVSGEIDEKSKFIPFWNREKGDELVPVYFYQGDKIHQSASGQHFIRSSSSDYNTIVTDVAFSSKLDGQDITLYKPTTEENDIDSTALFDVNGLWGYREIPSEAGNPFFILQKTNGDEFSSFKVYKVEIQLGSNDLTEGGGSVASPVADAHGYIIDDQPYFLIVNAVSDPRTYTVIDKTGASATYPLTGDDNKTINFTVGDKTVVVNLDDYSLVNTVTNGNIELNPAFPTNTPIPSPTETSIPSETPTVTSTPKPSETPTGTFTNTPTFTPTPSPTGTYTTTPDATKIMASITAATGSLNLPDFDHPETWPKNADDSHLTTDLTTDPVVLSINHNDVSDEEPQYGLLNTKTHVFYPLKVEHLTEVFDTQASLTIPNSWIDTDNISVRIGTDEYFGVSSVRSVNNFTIVSFESAISIPEFAHQKDIIVKDVVMDLSGKTTGVNFFTPANDIVYGNTHLNNVSGILENDDRTIEVYINPTSTTNTPLTLYGVNATSDGIVELLFDKKDNLTSVSCLDKSNCSLTFGQTILNLNFDETYTVYNNSADTIVTFSKDNDTSSENIVEILNVKPILLDSATNATFRPVTIQQDLNEKLDLQIDNKTNILYEYSNGEYKPVGVFYPIKDSYGNGYYRLADESGKLKNELIDSRNTIYPFSEDRNPIVAIVSDQNYGYEVANYEVTGRTAFINPDNPTEKVFLNGILTLQYGISNENFRTETLPGNNIHGNFRFFHLLLSNDDISNYKNGYYLVNNAGDAKFFAEDFKTYGTNRFVEIDKYYIDLSNGYKYGGFVNRETGEVAFFYRDGNLFDANLAQIDPANIFTFRRESNRDINTYVLIPLADNTVFKITASGNVVKIDDLPSENLRIISTDSGTTVIQPILTNDIETITTSFPKVSGTFDFDAYLREINNGKDEKSLLEEYGLLALGGVVTAAAVGAGTVYAKNKYDKRRQRLNEERDRERFKSPTKLPPPPAAVPKVASPVAKTAVEKAISRNRYENPDADIDKQLDYIKTLDLSDQARAFQIVPPVLSETFNNVTDLEQKLVQVNLNGTTGVIYEGGYEDNPVRVFVPTFLGESPGTTYYDTGNMVVVVRGNEYRGVEKFTLDENGAITMIEFSDLYGINANMQDHAMGAATDAKADYAIKGLRFNPDIAADADTVGISAVILQDQRTGLYGEVTEFDISTWETDPVITQKLNYPVRLEEKEGGGKIVHDHTQRFMYQIAQGQMPSSEMEYVYGQDNFYVDEHGCIVHMDGVSLPNGLDKRMEIESDDKKMELSDSGNLAHDVVIALNESPQEKVILGSKEEADRRMNEIIQTINAVVSSPKYADGYKRPAALSLTITVPYEENGNRHVLTITYNNTHVYDVGTDKTERITYPVMSSSATTTMPGPAFVENNSLISLVSNGYPNVHDKILPSEGFVISATDGITDVVSQSEILEICRFCKENYYSLDQQADAIESIILRRAADMKNISTSGLVEIPPVLKELLETMPKDLFFAPETNADDLSVVVLRWPETQSVKSDADVAPDQDFTRFFPAAATPGGDGAGGGTSPVTSIGEPADETLRLKATQALPAAPAAPELEIGESGEPDIEPDIDSAGVTAGAEPPRPGSELSDQAGTFFAVRPVEGVPDVMYVEATHELIGIDGAPVQEIPNLNLGTENAHAYQTDPEKLVITGISQDPIILNKDEELSYPTIPVYNNRGTTANLTFPGNIQIPSGKVEITPNSYDSFVARPEEETPLVVAGVSTRVPLSIRVPRDRKVLELVDFGPASSNSTIGTVENGELTLKPEAVTVLSDLFPAQLITTQAHEEETVYIYAGTTPVKMDLPDHEDQNIPTPITKGTLLYRKYGELRLAPVLPDLTFSTLRDKFKGETEQGSNITQWHAKNETLVVVPLGQQNVPLSLTRADIIEISTEPGAEAIISISLGRKPPLEKILTPNAVIGVPLPTTASAVLDNNDRRVYVERVTFDTDGKPTIVALSDGASLKLSETETRITYAPGVRKQINFENLEGEATATTYLAKAVQEGKEEKIIYSIEVGEKSRQKTLKVPSPTGEFVGVNTANLEQLELSVDNPAEDSTKSPATDQVKIAFAEGIDGEKAAEEYLGNLKPFVVNGSSKDISAANRVKTIEFLPDVKIIEFAGYGALFMCGETGKELLFEYIERIEQRGDVVTLSGSQLRVNSGDKTGNIIIRDGIAYRTIDGTEQPIGSENINIKLFEREGPVTSKPVVANEPTAAPATPTDDNGADLLAPPEVEPAPATDVFIAQPIINPFSDPGLAAELQRDGTIRVLGPELDVPSIDRRFETGQLRDLSEGKIPGAHMYSFPPKPGKPQSLVVTSLIDKKQEDGQTVQVPNYAVLVRDDTLSTSTNTLYKHLDDDNPVYIQGIPITIVNVIGTTPSERTIQLKSRDKGDYGIVIEDKFIVGGYIAVPASDEQTPKIFIAGVNCGTVDKEGILFSNGAPERLRELFSNRNGVYTYQGKKDIRILSQNGTIQTFSPGDKIYRAKNELWVKYYNI